MTELTAPPVTRTQYWYATLRERLVEAYDVVGPCHDLSHAVRVAFLAEHLAREEGAAVDLAVLAALLHDAGHAAAKRESTDDHQDRSARAAARILAPILDAAQLEQVVDAIAGRRFALRHRPRGPVGAVLDDADNLDAIGLVGVGRAYLWAGEFLVGAAAGDDPAALGAATAQVLRAHWQDKLRHLRAGMRTPTGARLAVYREAALTAFLDGIEAEVGHSIGLAGVEGALERPAGLGVGGLAL